MAARASRVSGGVRLDTSEFTRFAKACRRAAPAVAVELRANLRAAGELVAADARSRASFSSRVPASIGVQVRGATVSVVAGGRRAPEAAALENRGEGHPRHPLFGDREHWYTNNTPAFLTPAVHANIDAVMVLIVDALDKAVAEVGRG